jgi:hypothetical protein
MLLSCFSSLAGFDVAIEEYSGLPQDSGAASFHPASQLNKAGCCARAALAQGIKHAVPTPIPSAAQPWYRVTILQALKVSGSFRTLCPTANRPSSNASATWRAVPLEARDLLGNPQQDSLQIGFATPGRYCEPAPATEFQCWGDQANGPGKGAPVRVSNHGGARTVHLVKF